MSTQLLQDNDAGRQSEVAPPRPASPARHDARHGAVATLRPSTRVPSGWIVNGWFDSLFLSNAAWPLLAAALLWLGPAFQSGVSFWQVYFVSTPHRWITLALVFLDRRRFRERPAAFLGTAVVLTAACLGLRQSAGALTCVLVIDYVWNAWHFASQHAGIVRIYARQAKGAAAGSGWAEKLLMRMFVLAVMLRISDVAWMLVGQPLQGLGYFQDRLHLGFHQMLAWADWATVGVAAALLAVSRPGFGRAERGRSLYLISVISLYLVLLGAVHFRRLEVLPALIVVMALFHAAEYLALVTWSVHQRFPEQMPHPVEAETATRFFEETPHQSSMRPEGFNLLAAIVPQWGLTLALLCLGLGVAGWMADRRLAETWLTINLAVSFLHYAYDGMIWKRGRATGSAGAPPRFSLHN